jgi:hypothetical protein
MAIKFHEKAIAIYGVKQNSEGNCAVKDSTKVTGTITTTTNSTTITGVGTKFKYGSVAGDGLGELTVGAYIYNAAGTQIVGRVLSITSNTVAVLEANAAVALTGTGFSIGLGPKNCLAVINLNYSTELSTEASQYVGNELDRDEQTTITDKYCKMDFENFVPVLGEISGTNPTVTELPYPIWFEGAGLAAVLSADNSGSVQFTNEVQSNAFLTIEVRRSSQDNTTIHKTYLSYDCRGMLDFDGVIGAKGKFKWSFMGNFGGIFDKLRFEADTTELTKQKTNIATNLKATGIKTSQLSLYNGVNAPVFASGTKTVCFDKLSAPNLPGFEYNRYLTSCVDSWSKGAVPTDVNFTIQEDRASANYNPDSHLEENHSLWLEYSEDAQTAGSVLIYFKKLELVGITPSTIAQYAAQDLKFRNRGTTSITFTAKTVSTGGGGGSLTTSPKFGIGGAILASNQAGLISLLNSMTDVTGSTNGRNGSFSLTTTSGNYGWVAVTAAAYGSGIHFYDGIGYGGWSGAGLSGSNTGNSPDPSVSTVTLTYGGVDWVFFRQDYPNASPTPTTFTLS